MPRPHRARPRQLHNHKAYGSQPDPQSTRQRLSARSAQGRRLGRRFPRKPHQCLLTPSPDCPASLADRRGWCWLIGVPEGRNSYWDSYQYAISGADPEWDAFTWISADILPASEIESARRALSAEMFEQE